MPALTLAEIDERLVGITTVTGVDFEIRSESALVLFADGSLEVLGRRRNVLVVTGRRRPVRCIVVPGACDRSTSVRGECTVEVASLAGSCVPYSHITSTEVVEMSTDATLSSLMSYFSSPSTDTGWDPQVLDLSVGVTRIWMDELRSNVFAWGHEFSPYTTATHVYWQSTRDVWIKDSSLGLTNGYYEVEPDRFQTISSKYPVASLVRRAAPAGGRLLAWTKLRLPDHTNRELFTRACVQISTGASWFYGVYSRPYGAPGETLNDWASFDLTRTSPYPLRGRILKQTVTQTYWDDDTWRGYAWLPDQGWDLTSGSIIYLLWSYTAHASYNVDCAYIDLRIP